MVQRKGGAHGGSTFHAVQRATQRQRLSEGTEPWDILIIGGGASGLGVAVDAAAATIRRGGNATDRRGQPGGGVVALGSVPRWFRDRLYNTGRRAVRFFGGRVSLLSGQGNDS